MVQPLGGLYLETTETGWHLFDIWSDVSKAQEELANQHASAAEGDKRGSFGGALPMALLASLPP